MKVLSRRRVEAPVAPAPAGDELADLASKIGETEQALADAEAAVEQALADEAELPSLGAEVVIGTHDAAEYERHAAEVETRLIEGRKAKERHAAVLAELRRRAVALAEERAAEQRAKPSARLREAEARLLEAEALVHRCRLECEQAAAEIEEVAAETRFAAAPFDPAIAQRQREQEMQDGNNALQVARGSASQREAALARARPRERARLEKAIARVEAERASERDELREAAAASWRQLGVEYPFAPGEIPRV